MDPEDLEKIIEQQGLNPGVAEALRSFYAKATPTAQRSQDAPELALPERYEYQTLLGEGAMGEVHRVRDKALNRTTAMKILRPELAQRPMVAARFIDEAQATAQLEHPNIVPVHDFGTLPDGRGYFTMKEVRGDTLTEVAHAVHEASRVAGRWVQSDDGWTLPRLLDTFRQACQAVAHAHARGVLHRDLKPDNLMIGDYGELLVLDWGLAKVGHTLETPLDSVTLPRTKNDSLRTQVGTIAGTPAYMAPEQARGQVDILGPPADVYALGSILHFLLTGHAPYWGDAKAVVRAVRRGPPEARDPVAPVSDVLLEICRRAMAREPHDRFPSANELATAMIAYEDGASRRERALELVEEARAALPALWRLRRHAKLKTEEARQLEGSMKPWDPIESKAALWDLEDLAEQLTEEAELAEHEAVQLLRGALTHEPDMPEGHAVLAGLYKDRHQQAEAASDRRATRRYALLLEEHDRSGEHAAYLRGDGWLSLHTQPPAEAQLYRVVEEGRRLVEVFERALGPTPLTRVPVPRGSYIIKLKAPGHAEVRYPVAIGREGHWDGVPPGHTDPLPIRLPRENELGANEVYVPAGWFTPGGDPHLSNQLPHEPVWVQGFCIQRYPVTNGEYLEFLNSLVKIGRVSEAEGWAPRNRGAGGTSVYGRTPTGEFELAPDPEGDIWEADWPVLLISFSGARAFAAWKALQTGQDWRLPWEVEWEKSARGVDGRIAPWGNHIDPTWACVREGSSRPLPAVVNSFPIDESPYLVRGLAGNVADWCQDQPTPDERAFRGGAWSYSSSYSRVSIRRQAPEPSRAETIGVRIVRTLPV